MRTRQQGGVKRIGDSEEYRVMVEYILTPQERDHWGAGLVKPGLEKAVKGL